MSESLLRARAGSTGSDPTLSDRRDRIDAAARAALTGMLAKGERTTSDVRLAREAYDYAESLEEERARRIK